MIGKIDAGTIIFLTAIFIGLFSSTYMLLTTYENWGRHRTKKARKNLPSVCIIVPVLNEGEALRKTVHSLQLLDYPKELLEIMVVDDGSTDESYSLAKELGVTAYKKKNGGKHTALNYGLKRTAAELVGALDADSEVAPDALRKIVTRFRDNRVMAVTPSMKINTPKGILRRIQSVEFIIGIFLRRVFADVGSQHVTPGPFTIYRKEFFEKHGLYRSAHLTEDIEVALRIQSYDYLIENATDAYVYTHGPNSWKGLYRQRLRWYHGFLSNVWDYRHLFSRKHGNLGLFILPMSFISLAMLSLVISYTLFKTANTTIQNFYNYWLIGFDVWEIVELNFDLFFLNMSPVMLLGIVTFMLSVTMLLISRHYSGESKVAFSFVCFMLLYSWLYVFWWSAAFAHKILKRPVTWGHKSSD